MSESIKSRKYYRVHNGESWDRMHFVTDANSVDANDGDNMETKVGAIKGITTSTEVTEEGYAADATTVAALNSSLGNLDIRYNNETGKPEWSIRGADTFTPFSSGGQQIYYALPALCSHSSTSTTRATCTLTAPKSGNVRIYYFAFTVYYSAVSNTNDRKPAGSGLQGLATGATTIKYIDTTVTKGEVLTLTAGNDGYYMVPHSFFFMVYENDIDKDFYFSNIGLNGYSTNGASSTSCNLTVPKSGDVTIYYYAYARTTDGKYIESNTSGLQETVTKGSLILQSIETTVTEGEVLSLTTNSTTGYQLPACFFFMVYK